MPQYQTRMCDESLSEESVADNRLADGLTACAASRPVDDRRITDPVGGGAIRANGGVADLMVRTPIIGGSCTAYAVVETAV